LILGRVLRRVLGRSTYRQAASIYSALRARRQITREHHEAVRRSVESSLPPILVYQMAKVGSSTLTWALRDVAGLHVFQIHLMHPANIRRVRAALRKRGRILERLSSDMDIRGRILFKGLIKSGLKAKIITLVREPIGRNCSFYFQNLDLLWRIADAHENVEAAQLVSGFQDKFNHQGGLNWFDREFKPVLGVDVYEHPFPHDVGHVRITTDRYDILVLRSDLDDASKKKCVEEFLGIEGLSLAPKNVGSQKPYAAAYRKFLDALELPEPYVNEMLDSKYTRHFFSPDEIAALRAKWLHGKRILNRGATDDRR
jgi:hypothetical protein